MEAYHDNEWGRPEHDDRKLFEHLSLVQDRSPRKTGLETVRRVVFFLPIDIARAYARNFELAQRGSGRQVIAK